MLNLLRSDFYRLFKSKSYYICIAVEVFLTILGTIIVYLSSKMPGMEETYQDFLPKSGMEYGLSVMASSDIPMILSIIVALFVTAEFSHGTMKNVVSKGFSKIQIYLSKLITMVAASYIFLLVITLVATVSGTIIAGTVGDFTGEFVGTIFKTVGIEMLLYIGLTSILVMISILVRNLGGVIAINIIYVMIFEKLVLFLLELASKGKIEFSKYGLLNNISFYGMNTAVGSDYLRSVIVALGFIAVTTGLGILVFKKADVK